MGLLCCFIVIPSRPTAISSQIFQNGQILLSIIEIEKKNNTKELERFYIKGVWNSEYGLYQFLLK